MILFHFIFSCLCDNVQLVIDTRCKRNVVTVKRLPKLFILLNLALRINIQSIELNYLNETLEQTYSQNQVIIILLTDVVRDTHSLSAASFLLFI